MLMLIALSLVIIVVVGVEPNSSPPTPNQITGVVLDTHYYSLYDIIEACHRILNPISSPVPHSFSVQVNTRGMPHNPTQHVAISI